MTHPKLLAVAAAAVLCPVPFALANTVFDQMTLADPLVTSTLAGTSDTDNSLIRAGSFLITQPGPNTARGIRWIGVYYSGNAPLQDDFTIAFHADDPLQFVPTSPAFASYSVGNVSRIPLGLINADGGLRDGYEYFAPIPDTLLNSGVTYWLSIYNNVPGAAFWAWNTAATSFRSAALALPGTTWAANNSYIPAFAITTVPEPSCAAFLALGVVAGAARRARRRIR